MSPKGILVTKFKMTTESISTFIFSGSEWDSEEGVARFFYIIKHKGERFEFTEKLTFPKDQLLSTVPEALLKNVFDNLLLVLGVSYYKLFCPKEIVLQNIQLTKDQATFWNTLYTKGLGEFFYKNKIDFRGLITFPFTDKAKVEPINFSRKERSLIGIGGGKDSIVTAELFKKHKQPFTNFVMTMHPIQEEVVKLTGETSLIVKRELDPFLFELNKRDDIYNGHVPVSSHYAFIGLLCAVLYDYRYVIVSNEQSSNYGNVEYLGMEINHQWSKSFEFETILQEYIRQFITPDVTYFSLLRPLTELGITKRFAQYPQYFSHFSSCNRNFQITKKGSDKKWCGECAKCAFAFVMLATFLSKEQLVGIFGQNLFEKEELMQTYKELLGAADIKPFDCVGTPEEVQVACYLSMQREYRNDPVIKFFEEEVLPKIKDIKKLEQAAFAVSSDHHIPQVFKEVLSDEN